MRSLDLPFLHGMHCRHPRGNSGNGPVEKEEHKLYFEEIGLRICSVIRMVIVTRRDEQRWFVVFKYLSRRSNLVSIGTTRGPSTGELGLDPLRDGGSFLPTSPRQALGLIPPAI